MGYFKLSKLLFFVWITTLTALLSERSLAQEQSLDAQRFSFSSYGIRDGLPDEDIRSAIQDNSGFLWLGARHGGLSRFDGYNHTVFQNDPDDPTSLPGDFVWTMAIDRQGSLWVATTGGGLALFDEKTESFKVFRADPNNPNALPHDNITSLLQDSTGRFWVGTHGGLTLFDPEAEQFTRIAANSDGENAPSGTSARAILEDRTTGDIWFGFRRNGVSVLDAETGTYRHYRHDPETGNSLNSDAVNRIYQDRAGDIWIGTRNGLARFDRTTDSFKRYLHDEGDLSSLSGHRVTGITHDSLGRFWVATRTGLSLFVRESDTFIRVQTGSSFGAGGTTTELNNVFEDRFGDVWFLTVGEGVFHLDANPGRFSLDQAGLYGVENNLIKRREISAVMVDDANGIWTGLGRAGLSYRSPASGTVITPEEFRGLGMSTGRITAVAQEETGDIWIGQLGALNRYDGTTLERFPLAQESAEIKSISPNPGGGVWVAVHDFGVLFLKDGAFTEFPNDPNDPESFPSYYPTDILADPDGAGVWVGTSSHGLVHIDLQSGTVLRAGMSGPGQGDQSQIGITALRRAKDGILWLGTTDGVRGYDPEKDLFFKHLTLADGLTSSTITSLEIDDGGDLWIATIRGMVRWRPADNSFTRFDLRSDLFGAGIVPRAISVDGDGRLYWGTTSGILSTLPGDKDLNNFVPPIMFTDLTVDNVRVRAGDDTGAISTSLNNAEQIEIAARFSSFSLTFAALEFDGTASPMYSYRLEGVDKDWTSPTSDTRTARYVGLAPGMYEFSVRAMNSDGAWSQTPRILTVSVLPKWWQTGLVRILALSLLVGLIATFFIVQKRILLRFEELAKFADENPSPVLRFDADERLSYANPSSAPLSSSGMTVLGSEAPPLWRKMVRDVRENAKSQTLTSWKDDATGRTYDVTFSPLKSSTNVNVFAMDTTERNLTEEKLRRSQKMEAIGQLTGGISHDFNNLLAVVLGNLELLEETLVDHEHMSLISNAKKATLRGADLTRNILSFARQSSLKPAEIDLNKVVKQMEQWAARVLPETIDIKVCLAEDLWLVETDPNLTQNAILNLVINARDAMPNGGKLTIESTNMRLDRAFLDERGEDLLPGPYVMLAISDTGEGISQQNLERIFDPFYSTKEIGKGSGLGLSMVMGFMKQSGGTVRVYSELDVGTSFKIFFPASLANRRETNITEFTPVETSTSGARILVAEDEKGVMDILSQVLTVAGYDVIEARSGDEALALFRSSGKIDLILTDIVMPGSLQGPGLVKELRALQPDLPAVFMSGYAEEATVHGNGLRPEDIRLMKPVPRSDLIKAIETCLKMTKKG